MIQERSRPRAHGSIRALAGVALFFLYAPLVTMVVLSFLDQGKWSGVWYSHLFQNREILEACGLSLGIALVSTFISVGVGTLAAMALAQSRWMGRRFFQVLTYVPLIMPEIVMGLALLIWFVVVKISLGSVSIVLAHVTFSLSYVIATVGARLEELDPSLNDAARDLGASPLQILRRVTLPLIMPALISGAAMAFTLSFDDFLISFFVSGAGTDTLPLKIYSMIRFGVSPEVNALSTVLLALTGIVVMVVQRKGK